MAGTIAADTLTHSTAGSIATNYVVQGSAKAWASITQSGTPTTVGSYNVASITDIGTSICQVNFTNSMNDANYAVSGSTDYGAQTYSQFQYDVEATSNVRWHNSPDVSRSETDGNVRGAIHGDLA